MMKKLFSPQPNLSYPLMRDPQRQPKCYDLTDQEREAAARKVEELLREKRSKEQNVYYGA